LSFIIHHHETTIFFLKSNICIWKCYVDDVNVDVDVADVGECRKQQHSCLENILYFVHSLTFVRYKTYSIITADQMFPPISSPTNYYFTVKMENIEDLFYDGLIDPNIEILKLQSVINNHINTLKTLYIHNVDENNGMNRKSFQSIAIKLAGKQVMPATDEIFSCVTNLYEQGDELVGADTSMSASQFIGGIIRLANLKAMMMDGMVNTSALAIQTENFLSASSI
jgi:hypothetical protein